MDILEIEGIGPEYHKKLSAAGIDTIEELLKRGATPASRKDIEEATGIGHNLILKWVYLADLIRINGVGEEYSELLQAAGVNTVSDLAKQNEDKLFDKIIEINNKKNLVRQIPALPMVKDWINQAKSLPIIVATGDIDKKSKPVIQKRPLSLASPRPLRYKTITKPSSRPATSCLYSECANSYILKINLRYLYN